MQVMDVGTYMVMCLHVCVFVFVGSGGLTCISDAYIVSNVSYVYVYIYIYIYIYIYRIRSIETQALTQPCELVHIHNKVCMH